MQDTTTIRTLVADDYRAAAVFERHGIDFCCGGHRPVAEACRQRGIDPAVVVSDLEAALAQADPDSPRFNMWALDVLTGYIVANHHGYVRQAVDTLRVHTRKVADVHGDRHPEVRQIADRFEAIARELSGHMAKEEQMLFPYIEALAKAARGGEVPLAPFGTVQNPIRMMEIEHASAGDEMAAIRRLSAGYAPPPDACTTYSVTYQELRAFEADLHRHVHLENNILFPKALVLERQVRGAE